jgi:putative membrane protein
MGNSMRLIFAATVAVLVPAPPAIAAPTPGEAFIQQAIEGNLAEIREGEIARHKGTTPGIRRFGRILEHDHAMANQKAMAVAAGMGVAPPSMPSSKDQRTAARLERLSGKRFDRTFVKLEVKDHKRTIAKYRKAERGATGPAANYARQSLPVLEKHLHIAETLAREGQ